MQPQYPVNALQQRQRKRQLLPYTRAAVDIPHMCKHTKKKRLQAARSIIKYKHQTTRNGSHHPFILAAPTVYLWCINIQLKRHKVLRFRRIQNNLYGAEVIVPV
jgi:hypothetical protein